MRKKIFPLVLAGIIGFVSIPLNAYAFNKEGRHPPGGDQYNFSAETEDVSLVGSSESENSTPTYAFDTLSEAGNFVRNRLKSGNTQIFYVSVKEDIPEGLVRQLEKETYKCTGDASDSVGLWFYAGRTDFKSFGKAVMVNPRYGYFETRDEYTWLNHRCDELADELNLKKGAKEERAERIYDYIVRNVTYDYNAKDYHESVNGDERVIETHRDAYNAYGALHDGTTMCMGYTEAFARLANEAGIEADYASDWEEGQSDGHAYNIVKMNGRWYGVDTCWADPEKTAKTDPFFLFGSAFAKNMGYHRHPESYVLDSGYEYITHMERNNYRDGIAETPIIPVYRIYNPHSGEHFYTTSKAERNHLITVGWNFEGISWKSAETSGFPVYRLYNPNAGDHHYTASAGECNALVHLGWRYEGIAMYEFDYDQTDGDPIPVYRVYNPNAKCGAHFYTADVNELGMLEKLGWRQENTYTFAAS